jgi:peptidoglycan/xylan/chitin deacetylase (PgdA/CDA1 family)
MTILCYHAVEAGWTSPLAVTPAAFEAQAQWLARNRTVLPLDEAVQRLDASARLPTGHTSVTFDDGFASVYDNAFGVLKRYAIPATVFLVAETLAPQGRAVDWVDTPPPRPMRTLSLEQVLEMREAGVSFASHSWRHHDLTKLSFTDCVADLRQSRELLEDLLATKVPYLAYPRGLHDATVRMAAGKAGYSHAFSLPQWREPVGRLAVPRVGIFPGNGVRAMRLKLARPYVPIRMSPAFPLVKRLVRRPVRPVSARAGEPLEP